MDWQKFSYKGVDYDLSHLKDMELEFVQPGKGDKPAIRYPVLVEFSLHCFSEEIKHGDDPALRVADDREERTFCFKRYALSKFLPEIMQTLDQRKCNHTGHGNFVQIVFPDFEGEEVKYEIFFMPSKTKVNGTKRVRLYIQSAHVKDNPGYEPKARKARSIGLFVILHNTVHNKPIKGWPFGSKIKAPSEDEALKIRALEYIQALLETPEEVAGTHAVKHPVRCPCKGFST